MIFLALGFLLPIACGTSYSRDSLLEALVETGIDPQGAVCVTDDLEQHLSDNELSHLTTALTGAGDIESLSVDAQAALADAADDCSADFLDEYSRDETIDNLVNDAGLTREEATCVVDQLEDEVGTDKLDEVVNEDPENPPADVQEAFTNAYIDCLGFDE